MVEGLPDTEMGRTTIQVSEECADALYELKDRGESYEDVIWRLLKTAEDLEEE